MMGLQFTHPPVPDRGHAARTDDWL